MQSIGLLGKGEEQQIMVRGKDGGAKRPFASIHASAVSLASGDVLVTGGRWREQEVFLLSGANLAEWSRRQTMIFPRAGHASARTVVGQQEKVSTPITTLTLSWAI